MLVTPSNSISLFPYQPPPSAAGPAYDVRGQPFAMQFAAAIAPDTVATSASSPQQPQLQPGPTDLPSQPAIQSVTNLPWGQSIAYIIQATPAPSVQVATTSLLPTTPVIPPAIAATPVSTPAPTAPASQPAPAATSTSTKPLASTTAPAASQLPPSQQAINALSAILTSYGVDPASLGLRYSEQPVAGPTGSWSNNMITANFPNGKSQEYNMELTLRNPTVAAVEIMGMLGRRVVA